MFYIYKSAGYESMLSTFQFHILFNITFICVFYQLFSYVLYLTLGTYVVFIKCLISHFIHIYFIICLLTTYFEKKKKIISLTVRKKRNILFIEITFLLQYLQRELTDSALDSITSRGLDEDRGRLLLPFSAILSCTMEELPIFRRP